MFPGNHTVLKKQHKHGVYKTTSKTKQYVNVHVGHLESYDG